MRRGALESLGPGSGFTPGKMNQRSMVPVKNSSIWVPALSPSRRPSYEKSVLPPAAEGAAPAAAVSGGSATLLVLYEGGSALPDPCQGPASEPCWQNLERFPLAV